MASRPKRRPRLPQPCSRCPGEAVQLRKGLCRACYMRQLRGSPAAIPGSKCIACGIADPRILRAVQLADGRAVVACHNDAHLIRRARPRPRTVPEAVAACDVGLEVQAQRPGDNLEGVGEMASPGPAPSVESMLAALGAP